MSDRGKSDPEEKGRMRFDLDFEGVGSKPKPPVDPDTILEVSSQAGFRESGAPKKPKTAKATRAPKPSPEPPRRLVRSRSDRIHPFSVRLNQPTLDAIYRYAEEKPCPLAEVIEDLVALLEQKEA